MREELTQVFGSATLFYIEESFSEDWFVLPMTKPQDRFPAFNPIECWASAACSGKNQSGRSDRMNFLVDTCSMVRLPLRVPGEGLPDLATLVNLVSARW